MIRVLQVGCVVALVAVLWAVKSGLGAVFTWGGPGFVDGFLFGAGFMIAVYLLIIWVDPSSRPRKSSSEK